MVVHGLKFFGSGCELRVQRLGCKVGKLRLRI